MTPPQLTRAQKAFRAALALELRQGVTPPISLEEVEITFLLRGPARQVVPRFESNPPLEDKELLMPKRGREFKLRELILLVVVLRVCHLQAWVWTTHPRSQVAAWQLPFP